MFDAMADWMSVPLLQHEGGRTPQRVGLAHPSIAPYGVFKTRDGADVLISIQSDREWRVLATEVLGDASLADDLRFATNVERVKHRTATDGRVAAVFGATDVAALTDTLAAADIAFARVSDTAHLAVHPHLHRITIGTPSGPVAYPAPPHRRADYGAVPALGEHTEKIRAGVCAGGRVRRRRRLLPLLTSRVIARLVPATTGLLLGTKSGSAHQLCGGYWIARP